LIFALASPVLTQKVFGEKKPVLFVMVDNSMSMGVKEDGDSRLERVKEYLLGEAGGLMRLREKFQVKVFRFSQTAFEISDDEMEVIEPLGNTTDILHSLKSSLTGPKDHLSFLLFTDGQDTSGGDWVRDAKTLGYPINIVGVGEEEGVDIGIERVEAGEVCFEGCKKDVDIEVVNKGWKGEVVLVLKDEHDQVVVQREVEVKEGRSSIRFELKPKTPGLRTYKAEIVPVQGERILENNTFPFFINVLKKEIQVLYIGGGPTWEFKFLSRELQEDEAVDFSWVLFKNEKGELYKGSSLEGFPDHRELKRYDVVIIGALPRHMVSNEVLLRLVEFVSGGGGIIFLGGRNSFGSGGYKDTIVERIFPVTILSSEDFDPEPICLELTQYGRFHPLTSIINDPVENQVLWNTLPDLSGVNRSGVKPGTIVLATDDGGALPILCFARYGQGKCFAVLTDSLWRWRLQPDWSKGPMVYSEFLGRLIRFMSLPKVKRPVSLLLNKKILLLGEDTELRVMVRDSMFRPVSGAEVEVKIGGEEIRLREVEEGCYEGTFIPCTLGKVEVCVVARKGSIVLGKDRAEVVVDVPRVEFKRSGLNRTDLSRLARETGGKYFELGADPKIVEALEAKRINVTEVRTMNLGDRWPIFVISVSLLTLEWYLRKKRGLL
jgi:uncharacterized membrane protein